MCGYVLICLLNNLCGCVISIVMSSRYGISGVSCVIDMVVMLFGSVMFVYCMRLCSDVLFVVVKVCVKLIVSDVMNVLLSELSLLIMIIVNMIDLMVLVSVGLIIVSGVLIMLVSVVSVVFVLNSVVIMCGML